MRLALHMGRNLRELLATTDSAELSEWLAYDRIEPLPDSYWQSAQVCATVARAMGNADAEIAHFMPAGRPAANGRGGPPRQSHRQARNIIGGLVAAAQARDRRGGPPASPATTGPARTKAEG